MQNKYPRKDPIYVCLKNTTFPNKPKIFGDLAGFRKKKVINSFQLKEGKVLKLTGIFLYMKGLSSLQRLNLYVKV